LGLFNPIVGILADIMFKPDRKYTPIFPDILHRAIGYILIVTSFVVVYLGLDLIVANKGFYAGVSIWLALYVITLCVLQYKGWSKAPHDYKEEKE